MEAPKKPTFSIFIVKRLWDTDQIVLAFQKVLTFFLSNKEVEYILSLESSLKDYKFVKPFNESLATGSLQFVKTTDDENFDLVITIGGDGTILWAHRQLQLCKLPNFLCFNGGSLCYLSPYPIDNCESILDKIHSKVLSRSEFVVNQFSRLSTHLIKNRSTSTSSVDSQGFEFSCLNDLVLEKKTSEKFKVDVHINDSFATTVECDGLLISSSTGSTAYNLSLNQSMVLLPEVNCIVLNTICPTSLSFRPLVLPASAQIKLSINEKTKHLPRIVYDGNGKETMEIGDELTLTMSKVRLNMIKLDESEQSDSKWLNKLRKLRGWK